MRENTYTMKKKSGQTLLLILVFILLAAFAVMLLITSVNPAELFYSLLLLVASASQVRHYQKKRQYQKSLQITLTPSELVLQTAETTDTYPYHEYMFTTTIDKSLYIKRLLLLTKRQGEYREVDTGFDQKTFNAFLIDLMEKLKAKGMSQEQVKERLNLEGEITFSSSEPDREAQTVVAASALLCTCSLVLFVLSFRFLVAESPFISVALSVGLFIVAARYLLRFRKRKNTRRQLSLLLTEEQLTVRMGNREETFSFTEYEFGHPRNEFTGENTLYMIGKDGRKKGVATYLDIHTFRIFFDTLALRSREFKGA